MQPLGGSRRVVISGVGVVAPNGVGREAFWHACLEGRSGVRLQPRFEAAALDVRIGADCAALDVDSVLPERERRRVSRTAVLALAAGREALSHAAIEPARLDDEARAAIGVVLGTGGGAQDFMEGQYAHWFRGELKRVSAYGVSSGTMGTISSELSIALGLRGLSHVVTSGCSSSTDALAYAARLVRDGELDTVLCGGSDATLEPGIMAGFCVMQVLAKGWESEPTRASRPFDRRRNGFVLGEGAWMFVLEAEDVALRRGARPLARVLAAASTCDAYHRVRSEPSGAECARAMRLAIARAGLDAGAIDHVSLHGTATALNDRTEHAALRLVFEDRTGSIPMHAPKSLVGHPQGASGALGIALSVLALERQRLPPTINLDDPDPEMPLDLVADGPRPARLEHVLCNCLAFGSKNSALVLGRYAD